MDRPDGKGWPLDGVRVVELGSSVAAPYATWILAALGAEVIKVERPEVGDDARHWGPPFWHGASTYFQALNRDKRSITVDLKDEVERAWLRDFLAREADVVVQNFRPGLAERYGLGAKALTDASPRLIYCNIWAFGARGPLRDKPGYDPLMQAFGGIMSVTGESAGRPPVRVGTSIIDMGTGMWCAIGILGLLHRRAASGGGGIVDASLFETALGWMAYHAAAFQASGRLPSPHGTGMQGIAPYQAYTCSDGYLMVAAPNDHLYRRLAGVLGHPEWADDPRFAGNAERFSNLAELNALMEPVFATRSRAEWRAALDEAGIPCAPMQSVDEVLAEPQTAALGIVQGGGPGSLPLIGLPLSFDGARPPLYGAAPALGQDNDAVKDAAGDA